MTDDPATSEDATPIEAGMVVYDDDGTPLGVVDGLTGVGFEVDTDAKVEDDGETVSADDPQLTGDEVEATNEDEREAEQQEQIPGKEFGEGYIKWRCDECGEMGDLEDGLPTECPNCGSEAVYRWRED